MTGSLVVVGEAGRVRADQALAAGQLGQLEAGEPGRRGHRLRPEPAEVVVAQARELDRLQHRLAVLVLVAHDELEHVPVLDATLVDDIERAVADLLQVLARLPGAQERQFAPTGPRSLEGVIDLGEVLAQQPPAAEAVDHPQVFERGDVSEVPDERAHQGRVNPFEIGIGDRGHEGERPLAGIP